MYANDDDRIKPKTKDARGVTNVLRLSVGVLINFFLAPNLLIILSMLAFLMVAIFLNTAIYGSDFWTYVSKTRLPLRFTPHSLVEVLSGAQVSSTTRKQEVLQLVQS